MPSPSIPSKPIDSQDAPITEQLSSTPDATSTLGPNRIPVKKRRRKDAHTSPGPSASPMDCEWTSAIFHHGR